MISNNVLEKEFESRKRFGVRTPFIYDLVEEIRTIEGRVWHKEKKFWSFPTKKFDEVVSVIEKYTPQLAHSMRTKDSWAPYRKKAELIRRRELLNLKKSRKTSSNIEVPCNKGLAYEPFQLAGIEYSATKKASLNADEMGLGKAQPTDCKVLTPTGWKELGSLKEGDLVIGSNGKPTKVTGVFPQGVKEVYTVEFTDGSKTRCCKEHLWYVQTATQRFRGTDGRVLPLEEIKDDLSYKNGNKKHFIPVVDPVEFEEQVSKLELDPYLVGALIGDGSLRHQVGLSNPEKDIVKRVEEALPIGYKVSKCKGDNCDYIIVKNTQGWGTNEVKQTLKDLGLFGKLSIEKEIPKKYLFSSVENRIALLQGLLDTDGYIGKKDNYLEFYTSSPKLADQVKFLIQSLGGVCKTNSKFFEGRDRFTLSRISLPDNISPFYCEKKKSRVREEGRKYKPYRAFKSVTLAGKTECVCISVDSTNKLYVTEDMIVTHNTIQALGIMNMKQTTRNVVICPNNVKVNWSREAKKWLVNKDIEVIVLYSSSHLETHRRKDNFLYIINYDILKKLVGEKGFFSKISLDLVVLDEAHMAKNPKAQRTKFAYHLANKAEQKLFLTGTPILNKVDEIYPLLNNLRPDIWNNKWQFQSKFCQYVEDGYGRQYVGGKNLDILQESLRANVMIRRLKQDVLKDLPPKRRQIIEIPVSSRHKAAMQAEKKVDKRQLKALLKDLSDKGYNEKVLEKSVGKMQFIEHVSKVRHDTAVAKVPDVLEFVDNLLESVDKVLLFAHHRDVLHALNSHYGDLSVLLMGGMTPKKKQEAVDRFQEDPDVKVFVGGIIPAGVGLTLTAASTVVFAELDWVPGNLSQAEDRCHRKGQTDNVMVYHIVLENSIDYYLAETNVDKQAVIDKSLNNG